MGFAAGPYRYRQVPRREIGKLLPRYHPEGIERPAQEKTADYSEKGQVHSSKAIQAPKEKDLLIIQTWTENYPLLGQVYRLKEDFYDIYGSQSDIEARAVGEADMISETQLITAYSSKVIAVEDLPKEHIKEWIDDFWKTASEDEKAWLKTEFPRAFPEYKKWLQKKLGRDTAEDGGVEPKSNIG